MGRRLVLFSIAQLLTGSPSYIGDGVILFRSGIEEKDGRKSEILATSVEVASYLPAFPLREADISHVLAANICKKDGQQASWGEVYNSNCSHLLPSCHTTFCAPTHHRLMK